MNKEMKEENCHFKNPKNNIQKGDDQQKERQKTTTTDNRNTNSDEATSEWEACREIEREKECCATHGKFIRWVWICTNFTSHPNQQPNSINISSWISSFDWGFIATVIVGFQVRYTLNEDLFFLLSFRQYFFPLDSSSFLCVITFLCVGFFSFFANHLANQPVSEEFHSVELFKVTQKIYRSPKKRRRIDKIEYIKPFFCQICRSFGTFLIFFPFH